MPFKSEAQRRYLWQNHPEVAKKWAHKYGSKPEAKAALVKKAAAKRLKSGKK